MKTFYLYLFLCMCMVLIVLSCEKDDPPNHDPLPPEKGTIVVDEVYCPGLEGNLLNDDPVRKVTLYLPPGYDTETSRSYPVLYLLHGFLCDHDTWFGGTFSEIFNNEDLGITGLYMKKMLDTLIQKEYIQPMFIVCPSSFNSYDGSWYTNSVVTGQWEDFIVQDVVAHLDANYRTLAAVGSRGIAGHSMGAYGSMKIAMKHPDVFCSVYSMSGGITSIGTILEMRKNHFLQCMQMNYYNRF